MVRETLPYLTLPYLTLPYLTLPYLAGRFAPAHSGGVPKRAGSLAGAGDRRVGRVFADCTATNASALRPSRCHANKPLPRSIPLLWQVRASRGNDMVSTPAPPVRFEIVGVELAGRLEQLRTSPRPSHLLAAVLLAHAGVRHEADDELQALASENPGSGLLG